MRRDILVTYDISSDKRWRQVFKLMNGHGDHIQYSVFRCALSKVELTELKGRLAKVIHQAEDQVLFIDLGRIPEPRPRITPLGKPYSPVDPGSRVV
jgi:CRISPR-associated protein Cas2